MRQDIFILETLIDAFESVKETIRLDGATVARNETRTRTALIDPVLRALQYSDPSVVTPEYLIRFGPQTNAYRVADYALHAPNDRANPVALIEAKRMSEELTDDHREQVMEYALARQKSVRYFALTNGDRWELYEISKKGIQEVFDVSLSEESAEYCAEVFWMSFPIWSKQTQNRNWLGPNFRSNQGRPSSRNTLETQSPRTSDIHKVGTWSGIACFVSTVIAFAVGVWVAKPDFGFFAPVGISVLLIGIALGAMSWRHHIATGLHGLHGILRSRGTYALETATLRWQLIWLLAAFSGAGVFGGALGYVGGRRSAQTIADLLEGLGIVLIVLVILVLIVVAIFWAGDNNGRSRQKRRRTR